MKQEHRSDGYLYAVAGASRFGKTHWTLQRLQKPQRLLVWDPRGEYVQPARCQMIRNIPALARTLKEAWDGPGRFAYWGPITDFNAFAELAYVWAQLWPAVIVLEETSDVSSSGKARGAQGELIRKGLYYGTHIYAITQRPQETDKTTWGNASVIHCHHFSLPLDQEYMGKVLGVSPEEIGALRKGEWIERHAGKPGVIRGGNPC